jgi:hypothetical protein
VSSTYVAIVGTWPASVYTLEILKAEIQDRAPERPEDYITLYEQREDGTELRALELRTGEISRDDAFRYLRTMLIAVPIGRRSILKFSSDDVRGAIDWDVKL